MLGHMSAWVSAWLLPIAISARCINEEIISQNYSFLGEGVTVTLEQNKWLGAQVTAQSAALLMREVLGFNVELLDVAMDWGAQETPLTRLVDRKVDANLEAWKLDYPAALLQELVNNGSVTTSVHLFDGRVGVYIPLSVIEDNAGLVPEFWRSYHSKEVLELFRFANNSELERRAADWSQYCDPELYGCEPGLGRWHPSHCLDQECVPVLRVYPWYTTGYVEQLVQNLDLNMSVYYAGYEAFDMAREFAEQRRGVLFYAWRPHSLLTTGLFRRINFPERNPECEEKETYDRFGGRDCDIEAQLIYKLKSTSLRSKSIVANEFLERFSLTHSDQDSMQNAVGIQGQALSDAVCAWALDPVNIERWRQWLPHVPQPSCAEVSEATLESYPQLYHADMRACLQVGSGGDSGGAEIGVIVATVLGTLCGVIALGAICAGIWVQIKKYRDAMRVKEQAKKAQRQRAVRAVMGAQELQYSFNVIPFTTFRKLGFLMMHEDARDAGLLKAIDTTQRAMSFACSNLVIFISHQWLSREAPDPDGEHYGAICAAVEDLIVEYNGSVPKERVFVWVDYTCIPQLNRSMQLAAVSSIAAYAGCANTFISIAPPVQHKDTCAPADEATYARRGWCRLEQLSFILVHGLASAHVFGTGMSLLANKRGWLQQAINVFDGDFSVEKDKELLVDVLVGLYGLTVMVHDDDETGLMFLLEQNKSKVFPQKYFGDFIQILEEQLERGQRLFNRAVSGHIHPEHTRSVVGHATNECEFTKENFEELLEVRRALTKASKTFALSSSVMPVESHTPNGDEARFRRLSI